MFRFVHHKHSIQVRFDGQLVDALVCEAKLDEFNVLVLSELELVGGLGHLSSLVNFGHLDAIEIVSHADTLHETVSYKNFDFIKMEVLGFHEEKLVVKGRFFVFL